MADALRSLYGLTLAAWFGVIAFTSGAVLPLLLARVPDRFPQVVSSLFPLYFRTGEVMAAVAALLALGECLARPRGGGRGAALLRLAVALAALALVAYNAEWLLPRIDAARGTPAFGPLHARSMQANGLTALLALLGALLGTWRPGPAGGRPPLRLP